MGNREMNKWMGNREMNGKWGNKWIENVEND